MKKINSKHIILILALLLVIVAVILGLVMCGKEEPTDAPVDNKVTDVQDDEGKEEKDEEKEEEKESEKTPEPTVVSQEKETLKGDITDFKYGVKQQPVTYNTYDVYSDGTKKLVESVDDILYYHEGYNATMEQLKAEGEFAVNTYMSYYQEILALVNQARAEKGIAPLTLDMNLCQVASFRAAEIEYSGVFAHKRPDGTGCFAVTKYYGVTYEYLAENIAQGYKTPEAVVKAWKNDTTDYGYMMDARFTKLGVGFSDAGIHKEWVTVFSN